MRIRRRHVIYVQGYDPRGLAQYYRLFRTELRKATALYGLQAKVGRPQSVDDNTEDDTDDTDYPGWSGSKV